MEEYREIVEKIYDKQYTALKLFALWDLPSNTSEYLKTIYVAYFWFSLIFWILLFDFLMLMQIITNLDSMDEIIKVIFMLATALAMLGKFLTIKTKKQSFENFFKLMLNRKYLPQNVQEKEILLKCIKLNTIVRSYFTYVSYSSCGGILMTKLLSETKDFPVSLYLPVNLATNWKYNLIYTYVSLSTSAVCVINVAFDTLSTSFFIYLKGQLDILGYRLENIGRNENSSQDFILQQLKDCIRHYNRLLKLKYDIENLVSKPISLQIACSVFVLIANFYALSVHSDSGDMGNLIKIAMYQASMLSQIFILCYFANEMSLKSSELSFNLYTSDWYNWNKISRKLVLLMMLRFETPIPITSVNRCYSFNLAAFTSIVNSSYSYFTLLRRTGS